MTARINSAFTPSCCEFCSTSLSKSAAGIGSQGGELNGTGVSTHGTVKKDAAGVGAFPITPAICFIAATRCLARESAMLDWTAAWSGALPSCGIADCGDEGVDAADCGAVAGGGPAGDCAAGRLSAGGAAGAGGAT